MKRFLLFSRLLVSLVLLGLGAGGAWGKSVTYNITIDSSASGSNNVHWTATTVTSLTYDDVTWATSVTGTTSVTTSKTYAQIGSQKKPATQVTLSTKAFGGKKVISASLTGYCTSSEGPALTITAGATEMLSAKALVKGTSTKYESTKNDVTLGESDALTFTINSSVGAAIYISAIQVVYDDGNGDDIPSNETASASIDVTKLIVGQRDAVITTDPAGLVVRYESSPAGVLTVDETTGKVTAVAAGKTTITATWAEQEVGGTTYDAGSQDFDVTVLAIEDGVFDFTMGYNYDSGYKAGSVAVQSGTWTAGTVTMESAGRNCWFNETNFRIYKPTTTQAAGSMTFSVPDGKVITKIEFTGSNLGNMGAGVGTYSSGSTSTTWTGASKTVVFTANTDASNPAIVNTITVTYVDAEMVHVTGAGYATYSNASSALDLGKISGGKAYVVEGSAAGSYVSLVEKTSAVAAGTGLIFATDSGGEGDVVVAVAESGEDISGTNMLKATDGGSVAAGNYVFAYETGSFANAGFYKLGEATAVAAGKAYLSSEAVGSEAKFVGIGDLVTGIVATAAATETAADDAPAYNMAGQLVGKDYKGIVIRNGVKYLNK